MGLSHLLTYVPLGNPHTTRVYNLFYWSSHHSNKIIYLNGFIKINCTFPNYITLPLDVTLQRSFASNLILIARWLLYFPYTLSNIHITPGARRGNYLLRHILIRLWLYVLIKLQIPSVLHDYARALKTGVAQLPFK